MRFFLETVFFDKILGTKSRGIRLFSMESTADFLKEESSQREEQILIEQTLKGDLTAFDSLVTQYQGRVVAMAYQFVHNREEAQDLAQEAFVKAFQHLKGFRGDSKFSTWLFQIVMNLAKSRLRWMKVRKWFLWGQSIHDENSSVEIQDADPLPSEQAYTGELGQIIEAGIQELSEEYRILILLRDVQDLSYEEISRFLNLPIGTIKSRLNRARRALRELLPDRSLL